MKKSLVKRVLAAAMMVCMVLSMAVPASAAYKYTLKLHITERESSVKHSTGQASVITVEDDSSVSENGDLTTELVYLLAANFEGNAETNKSGLWQFESDAMGQTISEGLKANRASDAAWMEWLDAFAVDGNKITGDGSDKGDLVALLKNKAKVSDMDINTEYVLYYEPDNTVKLNPNKDHTLANDDPAKGNMYTFTLTLVRSVIGGGTTPSQPTVKDYAINVNSATGAVASADVERAEAGKTVTVTVKANEGYEIDTVTARYELSKELAITDNGDGTYTFTMPAAAVTVTVTTKPVQQPAAPSKPSDPGHGSNCPAARFDDVDLTAWYHEAIDYVVHHGLMVGVDEDSFGPDWELSRAMCAQIFFNLEGQPAGEYDNPFPDVAEGKWYHDAITWAFAHGVVSGYGDGLYRPEQDVTREELVQIYCNYAKAKGWSEGTRIADLTGFVDYQDIAPWHEVAVSWGVGSKLLGGKGGNVMAPKMPATRAEAAQMLMNMCENIKK